jgi:hypothetical protein
MESDYGTRCNERPATLAKREKPLSIVKMAAPCSCAIAAIKVSTVVRVIPFVRARRNKAAADHTSHKSTACFNDVSGS